VVTQYGSFRDTKVWANRIKAFEAALIGMSDAKLPSRVELGMVLEGNAPRPLSPVAQSIFAKALSSAAHIYTNVDAYEESRDNMEWLTKIDPITLNLDYDMGLWEAPDEAPSLSLGQYTRLTNLRIVNAKTDGKELLEFLNANMNTLRSVELKNVCLLWTDPSDYPWRMIFLTLARISALQYLLLDTLSAVPLGNVSRNIDYHAFQEVGWKNRMHVSCGLSVLCDYYDRQRASGIFVDMHYVDEEMLERYGIVV